MQRRLSRLAGSKALSLSLNMEGSGGSRGGALDHPKGGSLRSIPLMLGLTWKNGCMPKHGHRGGMKALKNGRDWEMAFGKGWRVPKERLHGHWELTGLLGVRKEGRFLVNLEDWVADAFQIGTLNGVVKVRVQYQLNHWVMGLWVSRHKWSKGGSTLGGWFCLIATEDVLGRLALPVSGEGGRALGILQQLGREVAWSTRQVGSVGVI